MSKRTVAEKVKEAKIYRSMGLLEESILIYEEFLSSEKHLDDATRNLFKSTVADIREELEFMENGKAEPLSEEEIAIIRDTLSANDGIPHILDSASALMELGLYTHALYDFEKLLGNGDTWKGVVQNFVTCLLKSSEPSEISTTVREMVGGVETNDRTKSEIHFRLGMEMHRRGFKIIAHELCCAAMALDPDNEEIEKWLDSNSFRRQILSKYDHLISRKKITPMQLKEALKLSKKTCKSIEFILIHHFKIRIKDLGKSLSLFYSCPFKRYNENILTPFDLIIVLNKKFLENARWVPLVSSEEVVEILIDDPNDLVRTDHIRMLLKAYSVNFFGWNQRGY